MLTLLTATGCRPEAWAITEKLAAAQTYAGPVRWIIVDDGEEAQPITFKREGWELVIVRPEPFWKPGQNTQARNLAEGLKLVTPGAKLVVWEDDDYYSDDWLQIVSYKLDSAELVGETMARYYNIKLRRARKLSNCMHSSLCSTGLRGVAIDALRRECVSGVQFIDMNLWRNFRGKKTLFSGGRVVGIKGMPGRGGIGMGHKPDFRGESDPDGSILRAWIGEDAALYE